MEETALGTIFDTYPVAGVARTITIADDGVPVRTKHGLVVVPRYDESAFYTVDRLYVTGIDPPSISTGTEQEPLIYLNTGTPERYVLEAALEDLAIHSTNSVAAFIAKRLEYRTDRLELRGVNN